MLNEMDSRKFSRRVLSYDNGKKYVPLDIFVDHNRFVKQNQM